LPRTRTTGTTWASSHARHVWTSIHDHIHEGHRVRLNQSKSVRILLGESLHELLVELRIFTHPLSDCSKLWVAEESCEAGRVSCTTSTASHWLGTARVGSYVGDFCLIAIVTHHIVGASEGSGSASNAGVASCNLSSDLVEINSLEEKAACHVGTATGQDQGQDALVTWLAGDGNHLVEGILRDARR